MDVIPEASPQKGGTRTKTKWTVGRGSAIVKIYLTPHSGRNYYTVSYWIDGKRKRHVFPTLEAAKAEANLKAVAFSNGDLGGVQMTNADSAAYCRAIALLAPLGMPLEFAASEFASAVKRLGSVSLSQAVDFYIARNPARYASKMTTEVAEEMVRIKRTDKLNERYVYQLEKDLKRFTDRFSCRLADIRGTEVDAWLRDLEVGPCRRNNFRTLVQKLFRFAISRKYLPKDHDEIDSVSVVKTLSRPIEIFTPQEMQDVFAHANPSLIPFLAIGAFSGIRHIEIQKLKWEDIHLDAGIIEIQAANAKTASRRIVPISDNLKAWLTLHREDYGFVCKHANMASEVRSLVGKMNLKRRAAWARSTGVREEQLKHTIKESKGRIKARRAVKRIKTRGHLPPPGGETAEMEGWKPFTWKQNVLRHSYISYRVAMIQNVAQVALEAGNSPKMIFKHYRELVRPDAAKAWFSIMPADCQKLANAETPNHNGTHLAGSSQAGSESKVIAPAGPSSTTGLTPDSA